MPAYSISPIDSLPLPGEMPLRELIDFGNHVQPVGPSRQQSCNTYLVLSHCTSFQNAYVACPAAGLSDFPASGLCRIMAFSNGSVVSQSPIVPKLCADKAKTAMQVRSRHTYTFHFPFVTQFTFSPTEVDFKALQELG